MFVESWIRVEAGQLSEAARLVSDILDVSERHGLETSRLMGTTQQVTVRALDALNGNEPNWPELAAHIATLSTLLDDMDERGVNLYHTHFDAVLGRLLTAVGQAERARRHLDAALQLANDTGMHFYDAELLRLRAHTHTDVEHRRANLAAARQLARRQAAPLFELRAAMDDFGLRGERARAALADAIDRFPVDSAFAERASATAVMNSAAPT